MSNPNASRPKADEQLSSKGLTRNELIPEAVRITPLPARKQLSPQRAFIGMFGLSGLLVLGIGLWVVMGRMSTNWKTAVLPHEAKRGVEIKSTAPDMLLGHFAYQEVPRQDLEPIGVGANGNILLRPAAAKQFLAMVAAAHSQGIALVPISGFRSISDQQRLFFGVAAQRGQVPTRRAEVSAPPGFSEHHTGYAVDVGDGDVPATNLSPKFEKTAAFKWLQSHAARFSFEMSFPKNNAQRVSYEPWHWRFVGDRDSLTTFYAARHPQPSN